MMRLDLSLVEVFCCVYEEGGFSKAAEKLRISQPTISGHIKNLEEYLGTKLFDRLPRQVVPTHAGQLLYRHGCAIIKEREAALHDLRKFLHRMEGSLVISASAFGEYVLPPIIASFRERFPAVKVELKISEPKDVCDDVLNDEAELGFTCAKIDAVGLEFRRMTSGELALVTPNNDEWRRVRAITLEHLAEKQFLSREAGSGLRQVVEQKLGRTLDEFNVVGSFGSNSAITQAVKTGMGVSVLPLLSLKTEIAEGKLKTVRLDGAAPLLFDFHAVLNRKRTLSPISEVFLECALDASGGRKAASQVAAH